MECQPPMDGPAKLAAAQHQLALILGFFARVDAKLSVVLGIDLAMLGVIFTRLVSAKNLSLLGVLAVLAFLALLLVSFIKLYGGSFPNVNGGHASLVFFREIQKQSESEFLARYRSVTPEQLADDYLAQAWRNAKILTMKFDRLKSAYVFMAWAALP